MEVNTLAKKDTEFEEYEVEEAENGMEAVEKCRQNDYDLIIEKLKAELEQNMII